MVTRGVVVVERVVVVWCVCVVLVVVVVLIYVGVIRSKNKNSHLSHVVTVGWWGCEGGRWFRASIYVCVIRSKKKPRISPMWLRERCQLGGRRVGLGR